MDHRKAISLTYQERERLRQSTEKSTKTAVASSIGITRTTLDKMLMMGRARKSIITKTIKFLGK